MYQCNGARASMDATSADARRQSSQFRIYQRNNHQQRFVCVCCFVVVLGSSIDNRRGVYIAACNILSPIDVGQVRFHARSVRELHAALDRHGGARCRRDVAGARSCRGDASSGRTRQAAAQRPTPMQIPRNRLARLHCLLVSLSGANVFFLATLKFETCLNRRLIL
jgi:hypothetical protein